MTIAHISQRAAQVFLGVPVTADPGTACRLPSIYKRAYRQRGFCVGETDAWNWIEVLCRPGAAEGLNDLRPPLHDLAEGICRHCQEDLPFDLSHPDDVAIILDRVLERGCPPELLGREARGVQGHSRKKGERMVDMMWTWMKETGPKAKSEMQDFAYGLSHPAVPLIVEDTRYAIEWNVTDVHWHSSYYIRNNDEGWNGEFMLSLVRQSSGFWGTNFAVYARKGYFVQESEERGSLWSAGRRPW